MFDVGCRVAVTDDVHDITFCFFFTAPTRLCTCMWRLERRERPLHWSGVSHIAKPELIMNGRHGEMWWQMSQVRRAVH